VQATLPIEQWTTSKGTRVLFVRADAIPMIDIAIHFDAGGRHSAADRAGLASLTASLLDAGSADLDEDAIAERFARTGAERSASASADGATVSLRSLTSEPQLTQAVGLLARVMASPSFPEPVLAREKDRMIARLRESATQPGTIAQRRFDGLLFGDHPYGRSATVDTVAAITRADLQQFHTRNYVTARGDRDDWCGRPDARRIDRRSFDRGAPARRGCAAWAGATPAAIARDGPDRSPGLPDPSAHRPARHRL
jgi:zinc protease